MYEIWVKATEESDWESYCIVETWDEGVNELRNAVENDGYEESTMTKVGKRP